MGFRETFGCSRRIVSVCAGLMLGVLGAGSAVRGQVPDVDALSFITNLQGELVNFETPLIRPVLVTEDGQYVVVANEPDQRIVFLLASDLSFVAEVPVGLGLTALAQRPGTQELWVSAAFSSAVMVVDMVTFSVSHVLRAAETDLLGWSASPGGIAFSPDASLAFVVASYRDGINRFDAINKTYLGSLDLAVEHNGSSVRLKEPRNIVRHGDIFYVSVFRSGNQTAAGNVVPLGLHPTILDFAKVDGQSLPDVDVVLLSAVDGSLVGVRQGVGTLIFDVVANPVSEKLVVSHMDARNGEFIGEASFPDGRMTFNAISFVDLAEPAGDALKVPLEDLSDGATTGSLAMPTGLAVDPTGRVYVAAYASSRVGVFDSAGVFEGFVDTDPGPRGLAVSPEGDTLYVLSRASSTVAAYDISAALPTAPLATYELFDPTYDNVVAGRKIFHDAANSGGQSTGCFSCHADLQSDGLAWDLSAYFGPPSGYTNEDPPEFWKDRKFSMTTQDLRSLEDTAPYHWRGEKKDIEGFNGAFEELIHGESLSEEDFALMKDYIFSGVFAANPKQGLNRLPRQEAAAGLLRFQQRNCVQCHTLPLGTSGSINGDITIGRDTPAGQNLNAINPPQLRGLWTKVSDLANVVEGGGTKKVPVTGFGLNSKGSQADLPQFLGTIFSGFPKGERDVLERFIDQLDSGIAPSANLSTRLDQATVADFLTGFWINQANAFYCDLVIHGRMDLGAGFVPVGLLFDRGQQAFVASDSTIGTFTLEQLVAEAEAGRAELVVLGVPVWSGERVGVDRDRDGVYDIDEVNQGSNPVNPDTDGDGFWDSYDDDPLVFNQSVSSTEAPTLLTMDVELVTTNSITLHYSTNTFSPTRVLYGLTSDYGESVGEPFPLPAGSNHWKRRHQVVLRGLDAGEQYHFQIQTLGQNGVEGRDIDRTIRVRSDAFDGIWISAMSVSAELDEGVWKLTSTVDVVDQDKQLVGGVDVRGFWTVLRDGVPILNQSGEVSRTDEEGHAIVTIVAPGATSGDEVVFVVPMYAGKPGEEIAGLVNLSRGERVFAWSESLVTEVSMVLP